MTESRMFLVSILDGFKTYIILNIYTMPTPSKIYVYLIDFLNSFQVSILIDQ